MQYNKDMRGNRNLLKAGRERHDEFYTQYEEIARELSGYDLSEKTVYCNCDDPRRSEFIHYFTDHPPKKLICTGLGYPYKVEITETGTKITRIASGRFEDNEETIKEADIVITNPPFSLMRVWIDKVLNSGKDFIVLASQNCITYRVVFQAIKEGRIHTGYNLHKQSMMFEIPGTYPLKGTGFRREGRQYVKVSGVIWLTSLRIPKPFARLTARYTGHETEYPHYLNYNAIEVGKVKDIPQDYEGVMGVPITFLRDMNEEQFKLIGLGHGSMGREAGVQDLEEKHLHQLRSRGKSVTGGGLYLMDNEELRCVYARLLIQRRT